MVEISTPIPSEPRMKMMLNPINTPRLPATVTPKKSWLSHNSANRLKMHTTSYGMILPSISSHERTGVTINCSMVPCSRSRTMASADRIKVCTCSRMAINPGIM